MGEIGWLAPFPPFSTQTKRERRSFRLDPRGHVEVEGRAKKSFRQMAPRDLSSRCKGNRRWILTCTAAGILVPLAVILCARPSAANKAAVDSWADKWCELNDCFGVKERQQASATIEFVEKEERRVTRR